MNIEQAEIDIATKIASGFSDVDCAILPESQSDFKVPTDKPRIWVSYGGADYDPSMNLGGGLAQNKKVKFEITVESRKLRGGTNAIYQLLPAVNSLLLGFTPTDCKKLTLSKEEFVDFKENIWTFRIIASTESIEVENIPDDTIDPPLQSATIGGTTVS